MNLVHVPDAKLPCQPAAAKADVPRKILLSGFILERFYRIGGLPLVQEHSARKGGAVANITQVIQALQVERSRAKKELTRLDEAIRALQTLMGPKARTAPKRASKPRRKMSAVTRRRMAAAQRARWVTFIRESSPA